MHALPSQRLVVVSNRLPLQATVDAGRRVKLQPGGGGLVSAMEPVLRRTGGTWIGWPGEGGVASLGAAALDFPYRIHGIDLSSEEVENYYDGFTNRTLWPLFHDLLGRTVFNETWWRYYQGVNRKFAEAAVSRIEDGSIVWAHDFHLLLFGSELRALRGDVRSSFFFHTPFPPQPLFHRLPWRRQIAESLLDYDVLGFQTASDLSAFAQTVTALCPDAEPFDLSDQEASWLWADRSVRAAVFPISIDFALWDSLGRAKRVCARAERFRGKNGHRKVILGVDRLDYSKGLPHRLRAFADLLADHPEEREKVLFLQIAVPSRTSVFEYKELKKEIDGLVGHINGRFGTPSWVPVNYLYRQFDRAELAAYYRAADVALVTSIKDGMNLVAKEFCGASTDNKGVLVLSEFTGAAAELANGALIVNPHDAAGTARALHQALHMPMEEQRARMETLRARLKAHDVHCWASEFLEAARGVGDRLRSPGDTLSAWAGWRAAKLLLFLDYDGTLSPIRPHPSMAAPDAQLVELIESVAELPGVTLAIASGRSLDDLSGWFPDPGVVLVGVHGAAWRHAGHEAPFLAGPETAAAIAAARRAIEPVARSSIGFIVEDKKYALAVHYRLLGITARQRYLPEVRLALHDVAAKRPGLRVLEGRSVLELTFAAANKGAAFRRLREELRLEEFPAAACGDDRTDEETFDALEHGDLAIHVGETPTAAHVVVRRPADVRELLRRLAVVRLEVAEASAGAGHPGARGG